jgi:RNA polymerase sigma factor (TIGR02999 family)
VLGDKDSVIPTDKSDVSARFPSHEAKKNRPDSGQAPADFTVLLNEWGAGRADALDRLTPLVYDELRQLARKHMRTERGSHTLQATAVVHEAFVRLIQANVALQDRAHFFAIVSRLMRRVLVDHAKSRARIKRNGGAPTNLGVTDLEPMATSDIDLVALDDALQGLTQLEPRLAEVVELFYFGGLTYEQIGTAMGISAATVHRDIRLARAWLLQEIGRGCRS